MPTTYVHECAFVVVQDMGAWLRARLDQHLVANGFTATRSRARDLIKRGEVCVDGEAATRAAMMVGPKNMITVNSTANRYVARSAEKLKAAMTHYNLSASKRVALDIGASTGGFTQVLLETGAQYVYAVDVGRDQLHSSLRTHKRVHDMSGTDARNLDHAHFAHPITAITADVSFISLQKALLVPMALATQDAWIIALIKPQFELGPKLVGKDGIVKDDALRHKAVDEIREFLSTTGWHVKDPIPSPISGKRGNLEYLIAATLQGA